MPRKKSPTLTSVEMEFMHVIWDHDGISADNVMKCLAEKGRVLADGAVRRMLTILREKGYVDREKFGGVYHYRAIVAKKKECQHVFNDLKDRLFRGSGKLMVASLFESMQEDREFFDEIRRHIDESEGENSHDNSCASDDDERFRI